MVAEEHALVADAALGGNVSETGWVRTDCPLCVMTTGKPDRRASLGVSATSGRYECYRCGASGRLPYDRDALPAVPARVRDEVPTKFEPPEGFLPLWAEPALSAEALEPARRHLLLDRQLPLEVWRRAALGACLHGRLRHRIIAPIFGPEGREWLGWVARDWTGRSRRKYLNPTGMRRAVILYQHAQLLRRTDEPALVVEGIFDVLPYLGRAVALLGKPTEQQLKLLKGTRRPLVVALDGDAWREGRALAKRLCLRGVRAGFVRLPPGEDPGSVDRSWLIEQASRAI